MFTLLAAFLQVLSKCVAKKEDLHITGFIYFEHVTAHGAEHELTQGCKDVKNSTEHAVKKIYYH